MLAIRVEDQELFDEESSKFIPQEGFELELEHSLLSLSEWESKWEKPFLAAKELTDEETLDYVRCMIVSPNPPPDALEKLSPEHLVAITEYIERKMTATWFRDDGQKTGPVETITAELVYYWMTIHHIPFECERWHLNRLFTLIRICDVKSTPPKKMSPEEIAQRNHELNKARREKLGTKG